MPYNLLGNSYETNYYTGVREDFAIYSALNCANRRPTKKILAFARNQLKTQFFLNVNNMKEKVMNAWKVCVVGPVISTNKINVLFNFFFINKKKRNVFIERLQAWYFLHASIYRFHYIHR